MKKYLRDSESVPFDHLFLDANNPRLAPENPPGYHDAAALFDPDRQSELERRAEDEFDLGSLEQAFLAQGWLAIDNIVVWRHPAVPDRWVVLEGNRRTATLRKVRSRRDREQAKLERMRGGSRKYSNHDVREQEQLVAGLDQLIADTDPLQVVPIDADTPEELADKLPRVLAVRHVTGAKKWLNYAEDIWLLTRYEDLFEERHSGAELRWVPDLVRQVADEASLTTTRAKRKLRAASCFSHFKRDFEDSLPEDEEFRPTDYFLFEEIVKRPFVRAQFALGEEDIHIPADREEVIFKWVFQEPRGDQQDAEDNPNIFYRHYNVEVWDRMKRHDDKHGTSFAARFDVESPDTTPRMREVEADFIAHKARRKPADVLEQLLAQLDELKFAQLASEGSFLRMQLERVESRIAQLLAMVEAAEATAAS